MDWITISSIITTIAALAVACSAIFAGWQIWELKKSTNITSFTNLWQFLQTEDIRMARRFLLNTLKNKDIKNWEEKDKLEVEKVCYTYDVAGIMASKGLIKKDLVTGWRNSIIESWKIAEPMITEYRKTRGKRFLERL